MAGYRIDIGVDANSFESGVRRGFIEPIEAAADTLQEIGNEGGRDIGLVERAARDTQGDVGEVQEGFRQIQREIGETGRNARTDFANPVRASSQKVSAELDEVAREAKQNAAEMFSSFDGSLGSTVDAVQSTFGGLVGGLGGFPAMALAAAGAAGIGLVGAAANAHQEAGAAVRRGITAEYQAAALAGRTYLEQEAILAMALEITSDTVRNAEAIADAEKIGISEITYIRGLAGDTGALEQSLAAARATSAQLVDELDYARGGESWSPTVQAVDRIADELESLTELHREGRSLARLFTEISDEISDSFQQANADAIAIDEHRWTARSESLQTAAAHPLRVRTDIALPDPEKVRRQMQSSYERKPLRVAEGKFKRSGNQVV